MKYNDDLVLPIENIDDDERSIMDGLMCDFVGTMVKLGTAIADDEKWDNGVVRGDGEGEGALPYAVYKTSGSTEAIVVFGFEILGEHYGAIGIHRNRRTGTTTMAMSGIEWVNGFSAIAAAFAKIYRGHYAEIHA